MPTFHLPKTEKLKPKFQKKSVEKVLRKWRFSDVMLSHFGSKNGKCLKTARMFSFEVRPNRKMPNGVKLNALQNGYLEFLILFHFDPKNSKFHFFKNNCLSNPKFSIYQTRKRNICDRDTYKNTETNFKAISLFLAMQ